MILKLCYYLFNWHCRCSTCIHADARHQRLYSDELMKLNPAMAAMQKNHFHSPAPSLINSGSSFVKSMMVDGTIPPTPPSITRSTR